MPSCIDLKARFDKRYRVVYEESYYADHGDGARREDPWLMILLCRYGHIFPHGGTTLAASVDGHPNVAGQLRRLKCCRVHQDGDHGELTARFDVADFAEVAQIMRPRRRRLVSAEQRERLRAMGFKKGSQSYYKSDPTARGGVPGPQGDPEYLLRQTALFRR